MHHQSAVDGTASLAMEASFRRFQTILFRDAISLTQVGRRPPTPRRRPPSPKINPPVKPSPRPTLQPPPPPPQSVPAPAPQSVTPPPQQHPPVKQSPPPPRRLPPAIPIAVQSPINNTNSIAGTNVTQMILPLQNWNNDSL
ncbi:hypothetical protein M9H77_28734 [Catharanthus roseus]|uniref:Uncharacterized protein n=1 Tax=Catharanthus roseus TaxID=4058 RepID=A0ACC0AKB3_CATRO|nr:hypothetical protein M9H77_28734 [Catharanthus roseus]